MPRSLPRAPRPPFSTQGWRELVDALNPIQRLILARCPELRDARTNPDRLVDIVAGRTRVHPLSAEGGVASFLLSRHMDSRELALRVFADPTFWTLLVKRGTVMALAAPREPHFAQRHLIVRCRCLEGRPD